MGNEVKIYGKCPSCGAPNGYGSRICEFCGSSLVEHQVILADPSDRLPDWDDFATLPVDPPLPATEPLADPLPSLRDAVPEPAPKVASEKKSFWQRLRSWKSFLGYWTLFCLALTLVLKVYKNEAFDLIAFVVIAFCFIPGVIFYAIWKHRNFRPPRWVAWIFELLIICFLSLFLIIDMETSSDVFGSIMAIILIVGIIWRIVYGRKYGKG